MDGVIVPTLVPPPLSPISSVSSESSLSLRKSLSKKSSLKKILSVTQCSQLLGESAEANVTDRSGALETASRVEEESFNEPSNTGFGTLVPPFLKRYSTEGSMDVDEYCAAQKPDDGGTSEKITVECPQVKDIPTMAEATGSVDDVGSDRPLVVENCTDTVSDAENNACSEDFEDVTRESARLSINDDDVHKESIPSDVADSATGKDMDEEQMDTEVNRQAETPEKTDESTDNTEPEVCVASPSVSVITPNSTSAPTKAINIGPPPIEILISFDTTGSMSYYLDEVKNEINNIIHRLFMDIPNLKIGVIAHGDYCDASIFYLTQAMELTSDVEGLCEMVKNVEGTGGGDFEECYELILRMVRQVKWTPGSQRALVMIGDACPHTTDSLTDMGKEPIDWKVEAAALKYEMGVNIYGVQCQDHKEAGTFWQDLAALTHGEHLKLDKFATIIDIILAICYRESGPNQLQAYELEVRAREGRMLATELDQAFQVLRGAPKPEAPVIAGPSVPAPKKPAKGLPKLTAQQKSKLKKQSIKAAQSKAKKEDSSNKQRGIKTAKQETPKKSTSKKATHRKSKKPVQKLLREQVTEAHFLLNQLNWTPWIKVISQHDHGAPSIWQKRHHGIGYKCTENFGTLDKCMHKRAIYEVAIQLIPRGKQIVVYNHVTKGVSNPDQHWSRLVFKSKVNKHIDNLFHQCPNATVSVRRAFVQRNKKLFGHSIGTADTCRAFINRNYDYAWKGQKSTRTLVKKGVTIVEKDPEC